MNNNKTSSPTTTKKVQSPWERKHRETLEYQIDRGWYFNNVDFPRKEKTEMDFFFKSNENIIR